MKPLKVAVGSANPVKVHAARRVMERIYGRGRVKVVGVKVSSGVPSQPVGFQTVQGAVNRAFNALREAEAQLGVGIEAGLFPVKAALTGYVDVQWCAVADGEGRVTLGCGPGFEMPPQVVKEALEGGSEVGAVIGRMFKVKRVGETVGAIWLLTRGKLSRAELTEHAVMMAMVPRLNPEIYHLNQE